MKTEKRTVQVIEDNRTWRIMIRREPGGTERFHGRQVHSSIPIPYVDHWFDSDAHNVGVGSSNDLNAILALRHFIEREQGLPVTVEICGTIYVF